jgi:hypothetical protein
VNSKVILEIPKNWLNINNSVEISSTEWHERSFIDYEMPH